MNISTITAIATPIGSGGIGIIKISGSEALTIAQKIFKKCSSKNDVIKTHRFYYGHIIDPKSNNIIDDVLFVYMKAPFSYTKEDVVEIHTHGSSFVLKNILELILECGAIIAQPGEFTKRAFLNGRIDLTQAEAVIDIINANSISALQSAAFHIKGELKNVVLSIKKNLLQIMTFLNAFIDFPDIFHDSSNSIDINKSLEFDVIKPLENILEQHKKFYSIKNNFIVSIVGRPNVGKSSILNKLIAKDRAIVTDIPGTTRDFIEEKINLKGITITISDTAGLQKTDDPIEKIGISKTHQYMQQSDLIILVIDASNPFVPSDIEIYETIKDKDIILAINKIDLIKKAADLEIPNTLNLFAYCQTSTLNNYGIDSLMSNIFLYIDSKFKDNHNSFIIPNYRQKTAIEKSLSASKSAVNNYTNKIPFEIISIDIGEAIEALNELLGINITDDILESIFSQFCIGK